MHLGNTNLVFYPEHVVISRKRQFAVGQWPPLLRERRPRQQSQSVGALLVHGHIDHHGHLTCLSPCFCVCVFVLCFGAVGVNGLVDHHDTATESMVNWSMSSCVCFLGGFAFVFSSFVFVF